MPAVDGLRSPADKTLGGLHHLGRMLDKIRLMQAGKLPADYHRNYGLSVGMDGQLCGFLGIRFEDVETRVRAGGSDAELAEWVLSQGLRPNRFQAFIWNEFSRKAGWNDRVTSFIEKVKQEEGHAPTSAVTAFELIDLREGRRLPPAPVS